MTKEEFLNLKKPKDKDKTLMLTISRPGGDYLFIEPEFIDEGVGEDAGVVYLLDKRVHHFIGETYSGTDHYGEPYEFTENQLKNISITDEKTVARVLQAFGVAGGIVNDFSN